MTSVLLAPLGADDLVVCDFDGTLSVRDTAMALIEALHLDAAWDAELEWRRGEIDSMECLRRQWGLVDLSAGELEAFFDGLALDPDLLTFVGLIRDRGAGLVILSDGLSLYLDRMLGHAGLKTTDDDAAVRGAGPILRFTNPARMTREGIVIEFPYANACGQCGNCKTEHFFRLRPGFTRTFYLGDGHSDLCAARFADVIFARDALAEDCQRAGRPYFPFGRLADVLAVLR